MAAPTLTLLRTQSDARLAALARDGHERAYEAIVERYRRELLRHAQRVVSEVRAEDVLQHALLAAWAALRRGDEVRDLRPWLHRIVHNASLNALRGSRDEYAELRESMRVGDAPEEELERRAVVRDTLAALAALPERQREALLRVAVQGHSQEEVAEDFGLTHGAVRQLVHRARTTLRAAATAITPLPLASWLASVGARAGEPAGARIAELASDTGSAGIASALAKAGVVVLLAGGAAAGPAIVERSGDRDSARAADVRTHAREPSRSSRPSRPPPLSPAAVALLAGPREDTRTTSSRHAARHRGSPDSRHRGSSGSRHRGSGDDDDRSGPGGGDSGSGDSGKSGSGSGGDDSGTSGSGSSGSGSGSSGSGSGSSGSGSGSSGSGSGSSGSGSGSSGSGSGSSGSGSGSGDIGSREVAEPVEIDSGSSGSGSSGSGSSGSGSGDSGSAGSSGSSAGSDDGRSGKG